jgi:hypothetical protein
MEAKPADTWKKNLIDKKQPKEPLQLRGRSCQKGKTKLMSTQGYTSQSGWKKTKTVFLNTMTTHTKCMKAHIQYILYTKKNHILLHNRQKNKNKKKIFINTLSKREKYNAKKTIRKINNNKTKEPQKIATTTRIPNNKNKKLQIPRKTSIASKYKRKEPKLNTKKLKKLRKTTQLPHQPKQKDTTKKALEKIIITKVYKNKNLKINTKDPTTSNNAKISKTPMLLKQTVNTTTTNITKQTHEITIKTTITKPPKHHQTEKTHQHKHTHASKRQKDIMERKIIITTQTNNKPPYYNNNYYNKKALLKCGDIESNLGPRYTPLLNHPQVHHERQQTYFYNKTTQIKPEYNHIFELFEPYLKHTQTTNINQNLTQFCINNSHCPKNYLFYAILITLAPTPIQSNSLIVENSTQWTTKLIESPRPLPAEPHILQKFQSENPHIIKPLDSIQKEIYLFITTKHPDLATLQHKFPYLPETMAIETLKCLQPIPNFTQPNPIQNHPPINPQNNQIQT